MTGLTSLLVERLTELYDISDFVSKVLDSVFVVIIQIFLYLIKEKVFFTG